MAARSVSNPPMDAPVNPTVDPNSAGYTTKTNTPIGTTSNAKPPGTNMDLMLTWISIVNTTEEKEEGC